MILLGILATIAQPAYPAPAPPPVIAPWFTVEHGAIRFTPNWSDYSIYPAAALRRGEEGQVSVSVRIDQTGIPRECVLRIASASQALNEGTCALAMQMRFNPAYDEWGKPIEAAWNGSIFWLLTDPRPFSSTEVTVMLTLAEGRVATCETTGWGAHAPVWQQSVCLNFNDTRWLLGDRRERASKISVLLTLDAGDGLVESRGRQPSGRLIGDQRIRFDVNRQGDADNCLIEHEHGLGERTYATQHACERLLSKLWFAKPATKDQRQAGKFRMQVYETD